jgi:hypothetical protein
MSLTTGQENTDWRRFIGKHWKAFGILVVACILAFVAAVYVFLWFVKTAQSTDLVPSTLGLWSMANLVTFILNVIFWELLLIGVPVVIGGVLGWYWWSRLPIEERKGYRLFGSRARTSSGGGGVSLFFFVLFCIKVYLDGNWGVAISSWSLDYVVNSMVLILEYVLVIIGIPVALAGIWWIHHQTKREPPQITGQPES